MKKSVDTYLPTDQPETCRKCGARTEVIKTFPLYEIHLCPLCQYKYYLLLEDDNEFEADDDEVDNVPSKNSKDFWK